MPELQYQPSDPPATGYQPTNTDYRTPYPAGQVHTSGYMPPAVYDGEPVAVEPTEPFQADYMPAEVYEIHEGVQDIARAPFDELGAKANPGGTGAQDAAAEGFRAQ